MKTLKHIENVTNLNELSEYYNDIRSYIKLNSYKHFKRFENINGFESIYSFEDVTTEVILKVQKAFEKGKSVNGGYIGKTFYSVIIQMLIDDSNYDKNDNVVEFDEPEFDEFDEQKESSAEELIEFLSQNMDEDEFDLLIYSQKITITDLANLMNVKYTLLYNNIQRIKEKAKKILMKYEEQKEK